jgi:signal transduction histidine kinase
VLLDVMMPEQDGFDTWPGKPVSLRIVNRAGLVEIEVSDGGKGISDALKAVLFQRFGSLEAQRGSERCGIGLGLYLVKLVAEAHGGDVSVHDAPGGGALFRMRLGAVRGTERIYVSERTIPTRMA